MNVSSLKNILNSQEKRKAFEAKIIILTGTFFCVATTAESTPFKATDVKAP